MIQSKKEITLGLIQMKCENDPQKNLDHAITRIQEAAKSGAQIICLQELFRSRYFCQVNDRKFFELAEAVPGGSTEILGKIAEENGVVIIASLFEKAGEEYFNTACVLDADGTFLGKYRKVHIPDDPNNFYSELFYFKPGDLGFKPFKTKYATIGVQVCWDQWYPEGARSLALQGAEILFYPTAIGWQIKGQEELGKAEYDAWVTVQRGHGISNTVFVAATNRTGVEDHLNFWGGSFVSDPLGRILGKASHDKEENLLVACDLNRIQEVRKDWPFLTCRQTEQYQLG
jgi:N-carbamoylputrescine amidase